MENYPISAILKELSILMEQDKEVEISAGYENYCGIIEDIDVVGDLLMLKTKRETMIVRISRITGFKYNHK